MGKNKSGRATRVTALLVIGSCLILFILAFMLIFNSSLMDILRRSESEYFSMQTEVVKGVIETYRENMADIGEDIAVWDETVAFLEGHEPDYIEKNWPEANPLQQYGYHYLLFTDMDGETHHISFHDILNDAPMDAPEGFAQALRPIIDRSLTTYADLEGEGRRSREAAQYGLVRIDGQVFSVLSIPVAIYGSEPVGVVSLGNIMDQVYFQSLTHFLQMDFVWLDEEEGAKREDANAYLLNDHIIASDLANEDITGKPLTLELSSDRAVFRESRRTAFSTLVALFFAIGIFFLAVYFLIVRVVIRPVETLSGEISRLSQDELIDEAKFVSSVELKSLAGSVNDLIKRLDQSNVSIHAMQSILNGINAYVYVTDPETDQILFINDMMRETFGLDGELAGLYCYETIQPDQTGRCAFCPVPRLKAEPGQSIEWEHEHPNGRIYRNIDGMIEWVDKRQVHLQHSVDITDLRRVESSLKRRLDQQVFLTDISNQFMATDFIPAAIAEAITLTGEFMGFDRVLISEYVPDKKLLNVTYAWYADDLDLVNLNDAEFPVSKDDYFYGELVKNRPNYMACDDIRRDARYASMEEAGVRAFLAMPVFITGELWGVLSFDYAKQAHHWTEDDIQLMLLVHGIISGAATRHAVEKDLISMSSIVNSSPQFITYFNTGGEIRYINNGAEEITGYTAEDLKEHGLRLLFEEEVAEEIIGKLLPQVLSREEISFERPIRRKDGVIRTLSFSIFLANDQTADMGAIASDITEKRELERALVAAKELAEQSSLAKSDFLSRMSHEMRTPMNAIIGMTNIAKNSDDLERKDYCLEKIDEASQHLLGVINDILDMSKIEAGKFEISTSEFDFEKMLMKVINVMTFRIDERKQTFLVDIEKGFPRRVVADEQRLSQVITNLLANAVKFTPEEGTIRLTASLLSRNEDGYEIQVDVADNGIGISKEQQSRLFRSFEQADGGISRRFGGTGLGLAISRNIVELMNGKIWVDSVPGEGSTFHFTIAAGRAEWEPEEPAIPSSADWKALRVLVVDDAEEVRIYLQALMDEYGIHCVTASGGPEACEIIEENRDKPFTIFFIDWRMPEMNGIELTRKIRKLYGAETIIIMISATEWSEIEVEAKQAGVNAFVPKPLFPSTLMNCINECLGPKKSREEEAPKIDENAECFAGRHILLAEDIEINREIVFSLLEETGVQIDSAENGLEAFEMFRANPGKYDMIFMDIHMPEVDGYEATRMIRGLGTEEAETIPIVAMTANVFREDIEKCLAAGMNSHVGKPIDPDQMIAVMREALNS